MSASQASTLLEQSKAPIVFALDQSTSGIGFSVWEDYKLVHFGFYEPPYQANAERRFFILAQWMERAILDIQSKRSRNIIVVFEDFSLQVRASGSTKFFDNRHNNVFTFKTLAQLLGALITKCFEMKVSYEIISPNEWKEALEIESVSRSQQKTEAICLVEEIFGEYADENEVDAICIGYAYIKKNSSEG